MFRFESPESLYLLALVPVLALFLYFARKWHDRTKARFGTPDLIRKLLENYDPRQLSYRNILNAAALILLILASANPQWGTKKEKVKASMADIYIAMDISNSMNAQDISPTRLERAKRMAEALILQHKTDQTALILFAGGAYLQMPLTHDYAAALMFLRSVNTRMTGTQGTDIAGAIDLAVRLSEQSGHPRALVIFSDGEDHDGDAGTAAKSAANKGFRIFTVGVGTEAGGLVPATDEGRNAYLMDESGNPVKSALNAAYLQELAAAANGSYHHISENEKALSDLKTELSNLRNTEGESRSYSAFNSYYQYLLWPAIILIMISLFFNGTLFQKRSWL
ncbi:MAG: VWA domain-containing protein [Saprospiraceae bacterium]|nr:VWA domain-containing protein [Saprospiraceae bacterium]